MRIWIILILILSVTLVSADDSQLNTQCFGDLELSVCYLGDLELSFFGLAPNITSTPEGGGTGGTILYDTGITTVNPKACQLIKNYLKEYGNNSVYLSTYLEKFRKDLNLNETFTVIEAYFKNYYKICIEEEEKPLSTVELIKEEPKKTLLYLFIAIFSMGLVIFLAIMTRRRLLIAKKGKKTAGEKGEKLYLDEKE